MNLKTRFEKTDNGLMLKKEKCTKKLVGWKDTSKKTTKQQNMFPLKTKRLTNVTRHTEKFTTTRARTKRLQVSAIPYMEKLLNHKEEENQKYNK